MRVSKINSLTIFRVKTLLVPLYILGFLCIMDQKVSNFLLYAHILIYQKIYFVTLVRFSQRLSHVLKNLHYTEVSHMYSRSFNAMT